MSEKGPIQAPVDGPADWAGPSRITSTAVPPEEAETTIQPIEDATTELTDTNNTWLVEYVGRK